MGTFYLLLTCAIWFGYTLLAMFSVGADEEQSTEESHENNENIHFITYLGMVSLSFLCLPSLLRLAIQKEPYQASQVQQVQEMLVSAFKMSFLLGVCNISFNEGYLKGSVTTSNQIQSTIPLWVYLMSLFYTPPGQTPIRPRFIKLFFTMCGMIGIYILASNDGKQSHLLLEGALWNTFCVACYAIYCIGLNCIVTENFNYAMFLGFLGVINVMWMTPTMILLHIWDV